MHAQVGTVGHPSTSPVTEFSVHLTFRIQESAYDPDVERPTLQQQADEMANAALNLIRDGLAGQCSDLLDEVEIGARGVTS